LQQQQETARAALGEWLINTPVLKFSLPARLPVIMPTNIWILNSQPTDMDELAAILQQHPMIRNVDQQIITSATGVKLAKQKYKPQWSVNASYGYRDDDPMGNDRSDYLSVGVSFDVPLFTGNRQDKEVQAAIYSQEALKTDKALALRSMQAQFEIVKSRLLRLDERKALYENRLLEQVYQQAEASLTAYTHDDGDFSEVVRARIAELDANIDFLNINVDRLIAISELNYFLSPSANQQVNQREQVSAYE
jgi:outer membrane protein TolC